MHPYFIRKINLWKFHFNVEFTVSKRQQINCEIIWLLNCATTILAPQTVIFMHKREALSSKIRPINVCLRLHHGTSSFRCLLTGPEPTHPSRLHVQSASCTSYTPGNIWIWMHPANSNAVQWPVGDSRYTRRLQGCTPINTFCIQNIQQQKNT